MVRKRWTIGVPMGIAIGVIAAVAVMMIGALITANLVLKETVSMNSIGLAAMCILAAATAAGTTLAMVLTKEKNLLVCGITALAVYLVLLCITAVFFDGMYRSMGLTAVAVLIGGGISLLPKLQKRAGNRKVKIPRYR